MAAVGGYTSVLELKPEEAGFNRANALLKELYSNLKMVHDLAGNLGNMKLTIKFDNGQTSEVNRIAQEERKKQSEQNKILREKEREFKLHGGGVLNTYPKPVILDTDKEKAKFEKDSNKELKEFASMLKWTIGVLATFKAALELGKAVSQNASTQSSVLNQSDLFGIDPNKMLSLRRVSQIYSTNHNQESLNETLNKLFEFKTNPGLRGQLDSGLALDLSQGLGVSITSEMFDKESMESILMRVFKGYAQKQKSHDRGTRDRANLALKTLTGDSGLDLGLMLSSQGLDLQGAVNQQSGNVNPTTVGQRQVSIEIGKTLADFTTITDEFLSQLGNNLLPGLKHMNEFLESHRKDIAGITDALAKSIAFIFDLVTLNWGDAMKIAMPDRSAEDLDKASKAFGLSGFDQAKRFRDLGILSNGPYDTNGSQQLMDFTGKILSGKITQDQLKAYETEAKKREKLKGISDAVGSEFNPLDKEFSERILAEKLSGMYKSRNMPIDELKDLLNNDRGLQALGKLGPSQKGAFDSKLMSDILGFIKGVEGREGKVDIYIHMPDGSIQKQRISMQKSQSMLRDNNVAESYEMTGSGISA